MTSDRELSLFRIWLVETDRALAPYDLTLVAPAERDRAYRYTRECDRNAFLKTRATLRWLIGSAVGADPRRIQFNENDWGKPTLAGKAARSISFSVSHTIDLSVIALSDGRRIGIDVERVRPIADRDRIANRVFGPSIARALTCLEDVVQDCAFLRLWTATEAFLKATGTGFAGTQERVPLSLSKRSGAVRLERQRKTEHEASLSLIQLSLPKGFVGSVVVESRQSAQVQSLRSALVC